MTPARLDLTIVIEAGSLRRPMPLVALAAALHIPSAHLRATLLGLLRDAFPLAPPPHLSGEPTEGVRSEAVDRSERKEVYSPERSIVRTGTTRACATSPLPANDGCVPMLVELLDDPEGERALRKLVEHHPRAVIEQALVRALAIPAERITRSRAAYFTALVRALDSRSPPPNPYDSLSSSSAT